MSDSPPSRDHITGFRKEIREAQGRSSDDFFTWFDHVHDTDEAFIRGAWDFSLHIAEPLAPFLSHPETKTALEIGAGGGRLLASASRHFQQVIGIDIHDQTEVIDAELKKRGVSNHKILVTDGKSIPLQQETIDVVYSFIVLQHVEKIDILQQYFSEIFRVLKPGGMAVLYVGRFSKFSLGKKQPVLYWLDRLGELIAFPGGYREYLARVNDVNLRLTLPHAKKNARECRFAIKHSVVSRKRVPDGYQIFGGQHGLVLQKPFNSC